ncbi:hypothetical protein Hanom_Chr04g00331931 [Helianthus anomalus]
MGTNFRHHYVLYSAATYLGCDRILKQLLVLVHWLSQLLVMVFFWVLLGPLFWILAGDRVSFALYDLMFGGCFDCFNGENDFCVWGLRSDLRFMRFCTPGV